jgi:peptidoglycan hydrolase-like protein with peptidoglycan-binding domain
MKHLVKSRSLKALVAVAALASAAALLPITGATAAESAGAKASTQTVAAARTYDCYGHWKQIGGEFYLYMGHDDTMSTYTGPKQENSRVIEVQCILSEWSDLDSALNPGSVDGIYGPNTERAVKNAQKLLFPGQSSQWDGKVGSNTWPRLRRLGEYLPG